VSGPAVSVVVAVRDGERYLAEALDSVLGQRPAPAEVVVVDDGSTDGTADVLARYGDAVRVERQPASGLAAALNRGVATADGDVVGFCDADDRWLPGKLAAQLDAFATGVDAVGGLVTEFLSPDAPDLASRVRVDPRPQRARLLAALLLTAGLVDRVGPFDPSLRHGANVDWISRADALGMHLVWVDVPVVQRRIHAANMGHDTAPARADLLRVLRRDRRRRAGTGPTGAGS
jgi:glycosyltransferase involved in cell wall biosynthesis